MALFSVVDKSELLRLRIFVQFSSLKRNREWLDRPLL